MKVSFVINGYKMRLKIHIIFLVLFLPIVSYAGTGNRQYSVGNNVKHHIGLLGGVGYGVLWDNYPEISSVGNVCGLVGLEYEMRINGFWLSFGPEVQYFAGKSLFNTTGTEVNIKDTYGVSAVYHYDFNQNEFDALVSFTYNLGEGCLCQLTDNKRRSKEEIAEKMLLYCNSGGNRIPGLVQRRKDERAYFLSGAASPTPEPKYILAVPTLRRRCKGDKVKILQRNLNDFFGAGLAVDGDFGAKTKAAVEFMQDALGITIDGIYGPKSCEALTMLAKARGYNICC